MLLVISARTATTLVSGVLVLTFCTSGITGYILGSIFVGKGASLVRVQNDFVSGVSHELRTPVTSIRLLHRIAARRPARGRRIASRCSSLLGARPTRLEELVDRVLELSRLESSHVVHARARRRRATLVEEAIAASMRAR